MAETKKRIYATNGAAAYDVYAMPEYDPSSAARKLRRPAELPREDAGAVREKKVRAKVLVAPFTVVGVAAVVLLLVMVIVGYVRLYEAKSAGGELDGQLSLAQEENARLMAQYENLINFDQIDTYAASHGMQKPNSAQMVYVNIPHGDVAQIHVNEEAGILERAWSAVCDGFAGLVEYLS